MGGRGEITREASLEEFGRRFISPVIEREGRGSGGRGEDVISSSCNSLGTQHTRASMSLVAIQVHRAPSKHPRYTASRVYQAPRSSGIQPPRYGKHQAALVHNILRAPSRRDTNHLAQRHNTPDNAFHFLAECFHECVARVSYGNNNT